MINLRNAKLFCSEDISLIENYHQALADTKKTWDVHHRKECDENGKTLFTCKQLIEMNLYYNRPASELIFVTRSLHWKIHREIRSKGGKIGGKISGKISGGNEAAKKAVKEKCSIPIIQFSKSGEFIREWPSTKEAERQLGIAQSNICKCCKCHRKSAGGYIWKYKKA